MANVEFPFKIGQIVKIKVGGRVGRILWLMIDAKSNQFATVLYDDETGKVNESTIRVEDLEAV